MTFRRRTFPEVLDNLLTDVAGGVAAEEHPFPPASGGPPFRHSLRQSAAIVTAVYGSRDGQPRLFRRETDYTVGPDGQTLQWQEGAELPDPGTLIQVNYFHDPGRPPLTDLQVGSVTRTLAETVGLELARLHAQLEVVYKAGFVDTATGSSLENVVALLGITRVRGGRAAGQVEFRRAAGTPGSITIPRGTRVMTADGEVEYETTESVTMSAGQEVARAAARDLENNDPLPADALTVLPAPIAGIAAVANPAPTALGTPDETDDELRERAKNFLHGSERATLGALRHAVARQQITADVVEFEDRPGYIEITPHAETMPPELKERLLRAIEDARPAGVVVKLNEVEPVRKVNLALRLVTLDNLPEADLRAAQRTVRSGIEDYFRRLPAREPASINQLVGAVLAVPQVKDVRVVAATVNGGNVLDAPAGLLQVGGFPTALGELTLADPNLPTVVSLLATFPSDQAPPDRTAIEAALAAALGYLSTLNTVELPTGATDAEKAHRVLSFRKLLRVVPLPGKPGATLEALDQAPGTPLPAEADVAPYRVKAVVTQESGLSRVLEHDADAYTLSPFERLVPGGVEVKAEATNG